MLSDCTNIKFPLRIDGEEPENDLEEQLGVLVEGIRNLTSILTTSSEYADGERRIEQLQSTWRLEDTGFSKLFNACKQMKNTLRLTSVEADNAFDELRRANQIASTAKLEEEKAKKKVCKLVKKNIELQAKNRILMTEVEDQKKHKKVIARSVRNFVRIVNEEQSIKSASSIPASKSSNLQYATSINSNEEDWEDISTVSSGLVTVDGCATIRFAESKAHKKEMYKEKIMRHNNVKVKCKKIMRHSNVLELSFPTKYVGIQFTSVLRTKGCHKGKEALRVCGFMGFDSTLNRQPAFGSRLVRVDGISLDKEQWKMENLVDYICEKNGPIQMSFCNELLTTAQIEHLKAGSKDLRI